MTTTTALLFCHKLPSLDINQFYDYIENEHVPLVKSLLKSKYPASHVRYYPNKDSGHVIGTPAVTDADLIAVITWESYEVMGESMRARQSDGIREIIEADEAKFMDRSKIQVIMLGKNEVGISERDD